MAEPTLLAELRTLANLANVAGMARFGITPKVQVYGISVPVLRKLARPYRKDHELAETLWTSGIHEARLIATMIDDPAKVTEAQMDRWVADFDSWDICDQCCGNLFNKTPWAYNKAVAWAARDEEFVKRGGFSLMAYLAVHDKKQSDDAFEAFLPIITREATDPRNFVKKAVNWALRQIGKRNRSLNALAIKTAESLQGSESAAARWVARDALRELTGEAVQQRLN